MLAVSKVNVSSARNKSMDSRNQSFQFKMHSQPLKDTVSFGRVMDKAQVDLLCGNLKYVNEIFTNILSKEFGKSRSALDNYPRSFEQGLAKKALSELLGCPEKEIFKKVDKMTLEEQLKTVEKLKGKGIDLYAFQTGVM